MKKSLFFLSGALIASLTLLCGMAFSQPVVPIITFDDTQHSLSGGQTITVTNSSFGSFTAAQSGTGNESATLTSLNIAGSGSVSQSDSPLGDSVDVSVTNLTALTLDVTQGLQASGSPYVSGGPLVEYARVTFSLQGTDFAGQSGAIILTEAASDPDNPGSISDIFTWVAVGVPGNTEPPHVIWDLFFESDYLGNNPQLIPGLTLGSFTLQEAPGFHPYNFFVGNDLLFQVQYASDSPIPEPSTILLLGAGLAGVGLLRRKLRK